ncbi:Ribosomal protein L30 [Macleaya cordata]|uniref:Ribosomal protein L30 n=1 Tax=Macleaya cordata TaxID=56857 RepID=A0A200Q6Q4_MACCD|nr:Ribosomal protein L30 [Macleaya cordata]
MAEESKPLNYISEVVLKKRRNNEDWAIKRREQSELRKQRNKQDKNLVFKRAEEYIKEYRNKVSNLGTLSWKT